MLITARSRRKQSCITSVVLNVWALIALHSDRATLIFAQLWHSVAACQESAGLWICMEKWSSQLPSSSFNIGFFRSGFYTRLADAGGPWSWFTAIYAGNPNQADLYPELAVLFPKQFPWCRWPMPANFCGNCFYETFYAADVFVGTYHLPESPQCEGILWNNRENVKGEICVHCPCPPCAEKGLPHHLCATYFPCGPSGQVLVAGSYSARPVCTGWTLPSLSRSLQMCMEIWESLSSWYMHTWEKQNETAYLGSCADIWGCLVDLLLMLSVVNCPDVMGKPFRNIWPVLVMDCMHN